MTAKSDTWHHILLLPFAGTLALGCMTWLTNLIGHVLAFTNAAILQTQIACIHMYTDRVRYYSCEYLYADGAYEKNERLVPPPFASGTSERVGKHQCRTHVKRRCWTNQPLHLPGACTRLNPRPGCSSVAIRPSARAAWGTPRIAYTISNATA